MTDIQPYQLEAEEPLQEEYDSNCVKLDISKNVRGETVSLTGTYVSPWTLIFLLPAFESYFQCSCIEFITLSSSSSHLRHDHVIPLLKKSSLPAK